MSCQVFIFNEILIANKVGDIEDNKKLIKKCGKLSKSKNSKSEILSKSKKHLVLDYAFILLSLVFADIQIEENDSLRYLIQNS